MVIRCEQPKDKCCYGTSRPWRKEKTGGLTRSGVIVVTADIESGRSVQLTFGVSKAIDLTLVSGRIAEEGDKLVIEGATVVVVDLDAGRADEMAGLSRLMARVGTWLPGCRSDARLR